MTSKTRAAFLAIALVVATGCEIERPVEIPKNPAPPPTAKPQVLDGATETIPNSDKAPTGERVTN